MNWKSLLFFTVFCAGFSVAATTAMASQSMAMPKCHFMGVVQDIAVREERGMGLSQGQIFTYVDVTVGQIQSEDDDTGYCNVDDVQTYQMRKSDTPRPKLGQCIQAFSNFSGDGNFMSGNWLTVESQFPEEFCEVDEVSK